MTVFTLPDLGEGLREAEIVAWHVAAGDHVVADQPLVSVETEKAVVEIPSPRAGRIARLAAEVGQMVETGAPLVEFGDVPAADTGTVVGEIPGAEKTPPAKVPPRPDADAAVGGKRVKAAPAVRALARKLGVDLSDLTPSGRAGQVTRADVERAAAARAPSETPPPSEVGAFAPLRGPRRSMARHMARARDTVAPATVTEEADIHAWPDGTDPTVRLIRATVASCGEEPALNAWFDEAREARLLHDSVDLGLAVDTPEGLFVPVLRDAGGLDEDGLRAALDMLKAKVSSRTVAPEEFKDPTITLSNFGMLGGRHAALVIMPPQVAILGAGRAAPRVVAVEDQIAVRRMMPLSLTFDHRAVTGGEAARFLAAVIADLERPD